MVELKKFVLQFFRDHQELLQNNYPGITSERLLREIKEIPQFGFKDSLEQLSFPYIAHKTDPYALLFQQLLQGVPLAYIAQKTYFYDFPFFITPKVFIPRLETEILVHMALQEIPSLDLEKNKRGTPLLPLAVADVGTGSGSILLSFLSSCKIKCQGYGIDKSPEALAVAQRNAYFLEFYRHPQTEVKFFQGDRLLGFNNRLHMVLTNPPYIKVRNDESGVHWAVKRYEPEMALFLDDDHYEDWFKKLFEDCLKLLYEGGVIIMEGHEDHLPELAKLAEKAGLVRVKCFEDLTGRPRFLKAYRPGN